MDFIKALPATRPAFLVLAPLCVSLGLSIAFNAGYNIDFTVVVLTMIGAISAAIAVNTLNEIQDFSSGLDLTTNRTPFSGGSGLLVSKPYLRQAVLRIAIASTITTVFIGLYFIVTATAYILPIGLLGLLIILTYTSWLNKSALLCYLAPGLGFGILMVSGSIAVQSLPIFPHYWLIAIIPSVVISNLLLVNQFPDRHADKTAGRNHMLVRYGFKPSAYLYLISSMLTAILLVVLVMQGVLPVVAFSTLVPLLMTIKVFSVIVNKGENISEHANMLGLNVFITLSTTFLLTISLIIG